MRSGSDQQSAWVRVWQRKQAVVDTLVVLISRLVLWVKARADFSGSNFWLALLRSRCRARASSSLLLLWRHKPVKRPASQQLIGVHFTDKGKTVCTRRPARFCTQSFGLLFFSRGYDGSSSSCITAERLSQPESAGAQHPHQRHRFGEDFKWQWKQHSAFTFSVDLLAW